MDKELATIHRVVAPSAELRPERIKELQQAAQRHGVFVGQVMERHGFDAKTALDEIEKWGG